MFSSVPLLLTSPLKPGKISEVVARLWVDPACYGGDGSSGSSAGAAPGSSVPAPAGSSSFCIPYGEMLND